MEYELTVHREQNKNMFRPQRIRDPLHNLIEFEAGEFESTLWDVICTPPFQRLRRIKQLAFSELVYPGATHSRFTHSVGVFHIARQLMRIVHRSLESEFRSRRAETALAAALVHDLGHGAFSHAFEDVGKRLKLKLAANHEDVSDTLIRESEVSEVLNKLGSGFAGDVADVIKRGPSDVYSAVVSSQFDADRLDYMQRDRLMTGSHHADIDFVWLMSNLQIEEVGSGVDESDLGKVPTFVIGPKAIHAAEAYVLGLFQLYPTVYFHKATRGAEKLFSQLLIRLVKLVRNGDHRLTGLAKAHPLVHFAADPEKMENMLALDDTVVLGALGNLSDAKDDEVREFAVSLHGRQLWHAIDIRADVSDKLRADRKVPKERVPVLVDLACAEIISHLEDLRDRSRGAPRALCDHAERVPYKRFNESKGLLNQIITKTEAGPVDLRSKSPVVAAIETFKLDRAYVRRGDDDSLELVQKVIDQGIVDAKAK